MKRLRVSLCLLFSVLLAGATGLVHARDAIVTDLRGVVTGANSVPVEVLAELDIGERFTLAGGASLTLVYLSGGTEYQITGPSRVTLAKVGPTLDGGRLVTRTSLLSREDGQRALRGGDKPATPFAAQGAILMRSGADARTRMHPRGRMLAAPAVFEWPATPGATARLRLIDSAGTVLLEDRVPGSSWQLPASVSLLAGHAYRWTLQVQDRGVTGPEWQLDFAIASEADAAGLQALRPAATAQVSERLLHLRLLQAAGFDGEAAAGWTQLRRERPEWPVQMPAARP